MHVRKKYILCWLIVVLGALQSTTSIYRYVVWKIKLGSLTERVIQCKDYREVTNTLLSVDLPKVDVHKGGEWYEYTQSNEMRKIRGKFFTCCYTWGPIPGVLPSSREYWSVKAPENQCVEIEFWRCRVPFTFKTYEKFYIGDQQSVLTDSKEWATVNVK